MAWTSSAYPGNGSASAETARPAMAQAMKDGGFAARIFNGPGLQAAGAAHLLVLTATVLNPTAQPLPFLLILTGLALIVLSLSHAETKPFTAEHGQLAAHAQPAAGQEPAFAQLDLERQSQRLVEIADAATRARREAELRGKVWADLTARISHELRTPLNAVIGFSDIMDAELFGPVGHDRYKEYSRHIRDSGQDLLKSAEDTLALTTCLGASNATHQAIALDLDLMVADAWSFFGATPQIKGIALNLDIAPGLDVLCERRPLRQILINLMTEALDRAHSGAVINVHAQNRGGIVELEFGVSDAIARPAQPQAPLAVCIARVLLELQGYELAEGIDPSGAWKAAASLEHGAQPDFFTMA